MPELTSAALKKLYKIELSYLQLILISNNNAYPQQMFQMSMWHSNLPTTIPPCQYGRLILKLFKKLWNEKKKFFSKNSVFHLRDFQASK